MVRIHPCPPNIPDTRCVSGIFICCGMVEPPNGWCVARTARRMDEEAIPSDCTKTGNQRPSPRVLLAHSTPVHQNKDNSQRIILIFLCFVVVISCVTSRKAAIFYILRKTCVTICGRNHLVKRIISFSFSK